MMRRVLSQGRQRHASPGGRLGQLGARARNLVPESLTALLFLVAVTVGWVVAFSFPVIAQGVRTADEQEILDAYIGFAEAQNRRDLDAVGARFVEGPEFLWVSDGRSFWGRDAALTRMGSFQKAQHWEVFPGLEEAEVVMIAQDVGLLHMPLTLEIGQTAAPSSLRFLVSILFRRVDNDWRIAALLTTNDKTPR